MHKRVLRVQGVLVSDEVAPFEIHLASDGGVQVGPGANSHSDSSFRATEKDLSIERYGSSANGLHDGVFPPFPAAPVSDLSACRQSRARSELIELMAELLCNPWLPKQDHPN